MTLKEGQIWVHVGSNGVPPTGLKVRVLRPDERRHGSWICDYPEWLARGEHSFLASDLMRSYALEAFGA